MKQVLDHGYVKIIETWGSDERIVESARMSTGKGFLGWGPRCRSCGDSINDPERDCPKPNGNTPLVDCGRGGHWFDQPGDEKLLRYLWENHHGTPFEMAGATFEVQAPIFVFREWHRHRVPFGYNEMSSRYTPLPDVNYIPTVERLMMGGGHLTKQAGAVGGAVALTPEAAERFRQQLRVVYDGLQSLYEDALTAGVPKELARVHLPVGRYSRMMVTGNLRGWLGFLALRSTAKGPTAQYEIRAYADVISEILTKQFPRTMEIFNGK